MSTADAAQARLIIVDRQIVADPWQTLPDDAPAPDSGDIIVSWDRWLADAATLRARSGRVGACCPSTVNPALSDALAGLSLIALSFPKFADGRPYTYARLLRQQRGFTGELRATGEVLRDQLLYLWRCGFNAFELSPGRDLTDALKAFDEFTVDYQPGTPARAGR